MSNDTKPLVSDERTLLRVVPSRISPDRWIVESSHLIGYDHVFDTEAEAKGVAVLVANVSKAQAAELTRLRELAQMLVDALADTNIRRIPAHARDDYRRGYQDALTEIKDPVYSALAKAKEDFDITPTDQ